MWTFDAIPVAKVREATGFAPDKAWLDRVQSNVVRLSSGCSGSVVSSEGLVLTNHHCVTSCLQALSSPGNDLVANGFASNRRQDERICPGGEATILRSITDVTGRISSAVAEVPAANVPQARAAAIAQIKSERCKTDRARSCDVVSLYHGGRYALYEYDRYTDVRIAFAPEQQAGFFGGDPDNFNFPRYAFDIALMRIYSEGRPVAFNAPLKLDPNGPTAGEPIFVAGHPGSTERLLTVSQLEFQRDHYLPWRIEYLSQLRGHLLTEATKGEEEARQVADALSNVENSVKVYQGRRSALVQRAVFASKVAEEQRLRDALTADPRLRDRHGDPFAEIDAAMAAQASVWLPREMLESRFGAGSVLLTDARRLVRASAERGKPDSSRLPEFTTSRLPSLERTLLAEAAVNPALERTYIAFWLEKTREYLGADHPAVRSLFGARTSAEIARDIVEGSQLSSVSYRRRLWDNPGLVATTKDPAIAFARLADSAARTARRAYDAAMSETLTAASTRVAALRFEVMGADIYPDATSTLRLSWGRVKGWTDPAHGPVPAFTLAGGLWQRATGAFPYNLAPRWVAARDEISPSTQFNFVSTNDITGGSSGSPALDREGRIVGVVFDGNIHSLGGAYGFDPALNRTVSVSSQIILEGLRKVYGATRLADELQPGP